MSELLSISELAKFVGMSRPNVSKLVNENGLRQKIDGKIMVDKIEFQSLLQRLAVEKKLRTRSPKSNQESPADFVNHLQEELKRIKEERDFLQDKVKSFEAVSLEIKLLKASDDHNKKTIENLLNQNELLNAKINDIEKEKMAKYDKLKQGVIGRILGL